MRTKVSLAVSLILAVFVLWGAGCDPSAFSPSSPSTITSAPRPCNVFPGSSGCHGGIGIAVQIVDHLRRSSTTCYDVYLNGYNCKHPGSPVCFGPQGDGRSHGSILGYWPPLSGTDQIIIVPQGTTPSNYCYWSIGGGHNTCAVETLEYGTASSPAACRR